LAGCCGPKLGGRCGAAGGCAGAELGAGAGVSGGGACGGAGVPGFCYGAAGRAAGGCVDCAKLSGASSIATKKIRMMVRMDFSCPFLDAPKKKDVPGLL